MVVKGDTQTGTDIRETGGGRAPRCQVNLCDRSKVSLVRQLEDGRSQQASQTDMRTM